MLEQREEQVHKDFSDRDPGVAACRGGIPEQERRKPDNDTIPDFVEPLQVRATQLEDNGEGRALVDEDNRRRPLSPEGRCRYVVSDLRRHEALPPFRCTY